MEIENDWYLCMKQRRNGTKKNEGIKKEKKKEKNGMVGIIKRKKMHISMLIGGVIK